MDLQSVKKQLEFELAQVEHELGHLMEQDPARSDLRDIDNEMEDDSLESEEGFRIQSLNIELSKRKATIQKVLVKIEQNTYGLCDKCGNQINPSRLKAIPISLYCVNCQALVDQNSDLMASVS